MMPQSVATGPDHAPEKSEKKPQAATPGGWSFRQQCDDGPKSPCPV